jgi:hypothetical protein
MHTRCSVDLSRQRQRKAKKRKLLINNRKDEENERSEKGKAGTLPPGI